MLIMQFAKLIQNSNFRIIEMIPILKIEFENQILVAWSILKKCFTQSKKNSFILVEPAWLEFFI